MLMVKVTSSESRVMTWEPMHIKGYCLQKRSLSLALHNAQVLKHFLHQHCHVAGYLRPESNYISSLLQYFTAVGAALADPITALCVAPRAASGLLLKHDQTY